MRRPRSTEESKAIEWWKNELSLNQQKTYAQEVRGSLWDYTWQSPSAILEVYKAKHQIPQPPAPTHNRGQSHSGERE